MAQQTTKTNYQLFVGIDVAATSVTVCWMPVSGRPTRAITISQTPAGFADLQRRLRSTGHAPASILIVMEATGTYWMALATTLAQAGFAVAVINPAQAHAAAHSLGQRQ
jgi:transposase